MMLNIETVGTKDIIWNVGKTVMLWSKILTVQMIPIQVYISTVAQLIRVATGIAMGITAMKIKEIRIVIVTAITITIRGNIWKQVQGATSLQII